MWEILYLYRLSRKLGLITEIPVQSKLFEASFFCWAYGPICFIIKIELYRIKMDELVEVYD